MVDGCWSICSLVACAAAFLILSKWMFGVLVCAHWFACLWGLQTQFARTPLDTWKGAFEFCYAVPDSTGAGRVCYECKVWT